MAKPSSTAYFILLLALTTVFDNKVKGDLCSEVLGGCLDCQPRCESQYQSGSGVCDRSSNPPQCRCYHNCLERQPNGLERPSSNNGKTCNVGLSPSSNECNNNSCSLKCAGKFPGGQGLCSPNPYSQCVCTVNC